MKDNFDLKKFLVENKTIEGLNPYFKKETLNEDNLRKKVREMIINELNPDYADYDEIEDLGDDESAEVRLGKDYLVDKGFDDYHDEKLSDYEEEKDEKEFWTDPAGGTHSSDEDDPAAMYVEESLEEAKEDEETEEEDVETEEVDVETEETTDTESESGLEDVAADMEGDEGDLMNNLMGALKIAKGMNNEKLATQIGNTLKFFVSEYISDKE